MKKLLLILILAQIMSCMYAQESIGEILATEAKISVEDLQLIIDGISTDIYSEKLLERAKAGDGAAQNALGYCYMHGDGIDIDINQALYWFRKSAENNFLKGLCSLGYMYENGIGVDENPEFAIELYRKSALKGFPVAWCNLAACYEEGIGTDIDVFRAKAWFEKGARYGYRLAQVRLSYLLYVDENYHDALYWLWRGAKQNSAAAYYYLAEFYKTGAFLQKDQNKSDQCLKIYEQLNNIYGQSSNTPILDTSYRYNIDISSFSDNDIISMIDSLLTENR